MATLAARVGVGGIFFANGWEKLEAGINATTEQFARLDAPLPYVWAAVTMLVELIGGAMLVAGFLVPACGILLFTEALAVFVVASGDPGRPLTGGDTNLIVALGAASVLLAVTGGGRASIDHMVVIKRRDPAGEAEPDPDAEADEVLTALRGPRGETQAAIAPGSAASAGGGTGPAASSAGSGKAAATSARPAAEPPDDDSAATAPVRARKTRQRRSDGGADGTAASRAEAPAAEKATAGKGSADKGDRLVAGGRESTSG